MKTLIRKCKNCGIYTLKLVCKKCGRETDPAIPPRFSPDDRYALLKARTRGKYGTSS